MDAFLENSNEENFHRLENILQQTKETSSEIQLAKTVVYCNFGYVKAQNGELQKAVDFYERAKQLYFQNHLENYDIIEYCLKPLGNLYIKTQALSEAENTIKHYILYAQQTGQPAQEISGIVNLSILYYSRGEFAKAQSILQQGLQIEPGNELLKLNLASAYFALGETEKTKGLLQDLLSVFPQNTGALKLLAAVNLSEKEYGTAIENLESALKISYLHFTLGIRERAKTHLLLAEAHLANGEMAKANAELEELYGQLIPTYGQDQKIPKQDQLFGDSVLMDALDLQAEIFFAKGKTEESMQCYLMADRVNDFILLHLYAQDSKLLAQQNVKRRSGKVMGLLYKKFKETQDPKWFERALILDAKTKGRAVAEAAALRRQLGVHGEQQLKTFQLLQQELFSLTEKIKEEAAKKNIDVIKLAEYQEEYSTALTQQRILYDDLQQNSPNMELHGILMKLKNKTALKDQTLVSYVMDSNKIYQLMVSGEEISFLQLANSEQAYLEIREAIRHYNQMFGSPAIINNDIPAFINASNSLYRYLKLPKRQNLVIVPDGILAFVPFQTLLVSTTRTQDFSKMPFLVWDTSLSYLLSLGDYLKEEIPLPAKSSVLGIFPVFKGTSRELGYSVYEAEAIASLFSGEMLMESDATAKNFIDKSAAPAILHISTHALGGTFQDDPYLLFFDREMDMQELYTLQLSSSLVVLSACDTGVGKYLKGEGALSLARGFQYAGAENVLFSLWQVNDKSTAELMELYYGNLHKTHSRNLSLALAGRDYLMDENIDNIQKSPYYWGAFVYYGATDSPSEIGGFKGIWIFGGIILFGAMCLLVFFWVKRIRRTK